MEHPPGLLYFYSRLHFFLLPPIAVYLAIKVGKQYLGLSTPTWIMAVATLLARPTLTFIRNRYIDLTNRRAATALGAVLPPHVQESCFTVAKKALAALDGFPGLPSSTKFTCITYLCIFLSKGDLMAGWSKSYGYTFTISRFTSCSVSRLQNPFCPNIPEIIIRS